VSFFIGLIVGIGRVSKNVIFRIPCTLYIEIIRGNPLILVIFWVYFFIPIFIKSYLDVFWSATIALTIFTGAYIGEIVRSGIQNIPRGQIEAAYGTGLSYASTMIHIILPQALKQMIPAIVGQFIAIFKDTSLAYIIGVLELTFVAQGLNSRLMIYPFEIYATVAVLYFVCCYTMSIIANRLERRLTPGGDVRMVM
jgi:polar amino acid transport system permease protein